MVNVRSVLVTLLLGAMLLGVLGSRLMAAEARRNSGKDAAPIVHIVGQGETLWSLARTNSPGRDPRAFIYDVQRLNGLQGAVVHPGQRLILPSG